MRILAWSAACVIVGAALGWATGRATHPQAPLAPAASGLPGVEAEPAAGAQAPLFAEATAAVADGDAGATGAPAAAPTASPTVAAAAGPAADPAAAAQAAAAAPPPTEILVIPHGPGRFAALDLQAAGLSQLSVYQGSMSRDGLANPAALLRAPKVATLRGEQVRVELLHLGFDRGAQPIAAHVRLVEGASAGVEGIALLRVARKGLPEAVVSLRPLAAEAAAPAEEEPQN